MSVAHSKLANQWSPLRLFFLQGNKILLCMSDVYGSDPKFLQTFECMEKSDAADPAISQIIDTNTTLSFIHRLSRACMTSQGETAHTLSPCTSMVHR